MTWEVFAEDDGTGLDQQANRDWADAANFAAHVHDDNAADYAPAPPTLTPDWTVPEVTLGPAQYRLTATDVSTRDHGDGSPATWPKATFAVQAPETTLAVATSSVNNIYVDLTLDGAPDDAEYVVVQDETNAPVAPRLKVAEVDTGAETTTVVCTAPEMEASGLTIGDHRIIFDPELGELVVIK